MRISDWSSDVCSSDLAREVSVGLIVPRMLYEAGMNVDRVGNVPAHAAPSQSSGIGICGERVISMCRERLRKSVPGFDVFFSECTRLLQRRLISLDQAAIGGTDRTSTGWGKRGDVRGVP